jgi:hypothetical protein
MGCARWVSPVGGRFIKPFLLGLYSKRPEWTQPENLDALFIGISEIVDNSKPEIVQAQPMCIKWLYYVDICDII